MKQKNTIQVKGQVIEALPSLLFKVKLDNGEELLVHLSGLMRINHIKILPGDIVLVERTPYDPKRGRIIRRLK